MALEYKFEQGQMRVKPSSAQGKLCWYLVILLSLLLLAGAAWLFISGYLIPADANANNTFATSLRGKINEQKHLVEMQKEKIKNLEQQLGIVKREREIQKVANEKLNIKLQLAEKKLGEASEELLLYGNILNKKDLKQGLHIQHFGLNLVEVDHNGNKLKDKNRYHYRVVLSYIRRDESSIEGHFSITITGKQGNRTTTLRHENLVPRDIGKALTRFSLKYYQSLESEIELPDGFKPDKVKLTVNPSTGKTIEKSYDWFTAIK